MTTKITPYTLKVTIEFIVCGNRRKLKEAIAQYQDPNSEYYGEYILCQSRLTDVLKTAKEQLQGLIYLFVDHSKEVKDLKTAQVVCLEDWRLQHFIAFSKQHQHIKTTTLKLVETETPLGEIQHG